MATFETLIVNVLNLPFFDLRLKSEAMHQQVACEVITDLDQLKEICPLLRVDDLQGGLWVPTDGVANPFEICKALAALSQDMGVK